MTALLDDDNDSGYNSTGERVAAMAMVVDWW
jgi:hypothetical protein